MDLHAALERYTERTENAKAAVEWLKANKESLVNSAVEVGKAGLPVETLEVYQYDIDDYLDWAIACLELGAVIQVEETDLTPQLIELKGWRASYVQAFSHIRDKAKESLDDNVASELAIVMNYLIRGLQKGQEPGLYDSEED